MNGTVIKKFASPNRYFTENSRWVPLNNINYYSYFHIACSRKHIVEHAHYSLFFFPSFPPNTALYYLKAKKQASTLRFQMIAIVCIDVVVSGGECFGVL